MRQPTIVAFAAAVMLAGCGTTANQQPPAIAGVDQPTFMQRQEVINATHECELAGMHPRMVYAYQTINQRRVPVPIDVYCEPAYRRPINPYAKAD